MRWMDETSETKHEKALSNTETWTFKGSLFLTTQSSRCIYCSLLGCEVTVKRSSSFTAQLILPDTWNVQIQSSLKLEWFNSILHTHTAGISGLRSVMKPSFDMFYNWLLIHLNWLCRKNVHYEIKSFISNSHSQHGEVA